MIRPARSEDAPAIAAFWAPWVENTAITFNPTAKTAAEVAEMIATRPCFFVAEAEGRVLGFATYSQFRGGLGYAKSQEHTVILAPETRGKGYGRALMAAIEAHARAEGHRLMIAGVSGANPEGRAFHEALGYQLYGTIPEAGYKFGRFIDLWLMGKLL